jgi:hypothetical protein
MIASSNLHINVMIPAISEPKEVLIDNFPPLVAFFICLFVFVFLNLGFPDFIATSYAMDA